jgi:hypothetical protein
MMNDEFNTKTLKEILNREEERGRRDIFRQKDGKRFFRVRAKRIYRSPQRICNTNAELREKTGAGILIMLAPAFFIFATS